MLRSLFTLCTPQALSCLRLQGNQIRSPYKQHPDETYAVYTQCLKDGEASDNCEFAHRAALMFAQEGQPGVKEKFEAIFQQEAEKRNAVTQ